MFAVILFIVLQLGDLITMAMLPTGSEVNPIAYTPFAMVLKIALILYILIAPFGKYRNNVYLVACTVGSIGLAGNLTVLLAH